MPALHTRVLASPLVGSIFLENYPYALWQFTGRDGWLQPGMPCGTCMGLLIVFSCSLSFEIFGGKRAEVRI